MANKHISEISHLNDLQILTEGPQYNNGQLCYSDSVTIDRKHQKSLQESRHAILDKEREKY